MTVAATASAFSALGFFNSGGVGRIQWRKLSPRISARFSIKPSNFSGKNARVQFRASASGGIQSYDSENKAEPRTYAWPDKKRPRICILGGGFGGLYTALRLESLVWPDEKKPQVVLVDQCEHFVFKPMLYELLSGEVDPWEIAPRFTDLLANTGVQFFKDRVTCFCPSDALGMNPPTVSGAGGTVHLESGLLIEYDWLVLALGAQAKLESVPGAAEYALPFSTLEDARMVDEKLKALERQNFGKDSQIRVAVVGCGYSGVELAATVSERLQDKGIVEAINVENTVLSNAPVGNREAALKVLSSRKVKLLLGYFVRCIREVDKSGIHDKETAKSHRNLILELQPAERGVQSQMLEADLVLWTVGTKSLLPLLEPSDKPHKIPLNARGQAETDETLRVKGHPRIFAVGDSSAFRDSSGKLLPASAQVAFQQADFAGWNLWAAINDRPLLPFRIESKGAYALLAEVKLCMPDLYDAMKWFQNLGEMMTLGRYDGAISPSFIEGLTLEGPIGHTARKLAYLIRLPTDEHRVKVGFSWLAKTAVESLALLQDNLTKVVSGS